MLVKVFIATRNQRPAMLSLMLRRVISPLIFWYFSYSIFSLVNNFTNICPLTLSVSFRTWLISSFFSCDFSARLQRVFPTLFVGSTNNGTIIIPTVARIQFFWYIATTEVASTAILLKMLVRVLEITLCTPEISLVIRVITSPCLLLVKKRWDIFCKWAYIWLRMS